MNKLALTLISAVALAASVPALAQQAPAPAQPPAATPAPAAPAAAPATKTAIPSGVFYRGQGPQQYLAKDRLIGSNVVNKDGTVIGAIEDLVMGSNNEIQGVIIGVGGFAGLGEKKVGVRYSALQISNKDGKRTIALPQATKDVLAAVDGFQRAEAKKSLLEKAKERAKELTDKTKSSDAAAKAKELGAKASEKGKAVIDAAKEKAGVGQPAPKAP
jgi:sporulation protein YlmC with PRC-barrel domain